MSRRSRQLELEIPKTWGGKREGAGRKLAPGKKRSVSHRERPVHKESYPTHVTLRAQAGLPSLRAPRVFAAVEGAIAAGQKSAFRVLHFSVQGDHVHLMVEAHDKEALSRGVQGLVIRAARAINRALARSGRVWGDRYHARDLTTPREVRNGIVYVLMNVKKHRPSWRGLDRCSSAGWFDGFVDGSAVLAAARVEGVRPPVAQARSWLGAVGWRRHGLIHPRESPKPFL